MSAWAEIEPLEAGVWMSIFTSIVVPTVKFPRLQVTVPLECTHASEPGEEDTNITSAGNFMTKTIPVALDTPWFFIDRV